MGTTLNPLARPVALALVAVVAMAGCHTTPADRVLHPAPEHFSEVNVALVQALNRSSIDAAILEQRTLYPYHFVRDSDQLNDLGRRDLHILLAHFREFSHPSTVPTINVRQAGTPESLYEARVSRVARLIVASGIDANRIEITDGMPGGDGVIAQRAILIHQREQAAASDGRDRLDAGGRGGVGFGR